MIKTANIFARVEPEIKEQAEKVLEKLGIPMSNAIGLFLRQVVMHRGIPFDIKLSQNKPLSVEELGEDRFNTEIEKGMTDLKSGRVVPAEMVFDNMLKDYGL